MPRRRNAVRESTKKQNDVEVKSKVEKKTVVKKDKPAVSAKRTAVMEDDPAVPAKRNAVKKDEPAVPAKRNAVKKDEPAIPAKRNAVKKDKPAVSEKKNAVANKKPTVPVEEQKQKVKSKKRVLPVKDDEKNTVPEKAKRPKLASLQVKGHLLSCGQGDIGQLGQGEDVFEKPRPGLVTFESEDVANGIVDVASGGMHTVCLTFDGKVYTFGCNDEGALGRVTEGIEGAEFKPGFVDIPNKVVGISAGDCHSAALSEDGVVYIWGTFRDSSGPMGLVDPKKTEMSPVVMIEDIAITKIQSGNNHLVCLSQDGQIYTCGCAEQGQLGRVAEYFSNRGGRKGIEWILSPGNLHVKKIRGQKVVFEDVWSGSYATYAKVKGSNKIYACGLNNYFQLGLDGMHNRYQLELVNSFNGKDVKMISGGQHHTLVIDNEGKAYSLGRKEYGRLGLGEGCEDAKVPTLISALSDSTCTHISSNISVSFAVDKEGNTYSWGMGTNHQLGHGDDDDKFVPTPITSKAMLARKTIKVSGGGQHALLLAFKKESGQ